MPLIPASVVYTKSIFYLKLAIDSLLISHVESSWLNSDMCILESSQKDERITQPVIPWKPTKSLERWMVAKSYAKKILRKTLTFTERYSPAYIKFHSNRCNYKRMNMQQHLRHHSTVHTTFAFTDADIGFVHAVLINPWVATRKWFAVSFCYGRPLSLIMAAALHNFVATNC